MLRTDTVKIKLVSSLDVLSVKEHLSERHANADTAAAQQKATGSKLRQVSWRP